MVFRKATIRDYDLIISLWEDSGLSHRIKGRDRREKMEIEMNHDISAFIIGEIDDKAVSVVLASHDGRKGWINRLAVLPDFRRRGIGFQMIKEAEKYLESEGIDIYTCLIEDWNKASMKMFINAGYVKHEEIVYFSKRRYQEV